MKQLLFIIAIFFLMEQGAEAQTSRQFHSWWTYSGSHKVADNVSVHTMYSFRRSDFVENWQQSLLRLGINYHYHQNLVFTGGYDWAINYPYGEQPIGKRTVEQRIYEQVVMKTNLGILGVSNTYRLEQRFLNNETRHRLRYRSGVDIPLTKNGTAKHKLSLELFDEVFINLGAKAKGHYFDQNWAYAGLAYKANKNTAIKLGYMNQYLVKTDNIHIENNHTLQVGLVYNMDLRKGKV